MSRANIMYELANAVMEPASGTPQVFLKDSAGNALFAYGNTVPTDTTAGYAVGCIFLHADGGVGTMIYCNEGSATSCDFDAIVPS